MKHFVPLTVALSATLLACSPAVDTPPRSPDGNALAQVMEDAEARLGGTAMLFFVWDGRSASLGSLNDDDPESIGVNAPLRIASNTKTFVAVAALKLVEQDVLSLDGPIRDHLPEPHVRQLEDGGYNVDAISLRMLLNHTSGIPDHAQTVFYFDEILADFDKEWTREDQVRIAMRMADPIGAPGERFSYSDTGYVLVGAMIEQATGQALGPAVRELAYGDLLLRDTWWEVMEPAPEHVEQRFAQEAFGGSLWRIHPSVDLYGGGGLVSTLGDLAKFHTAAARGELLDDPALNAALVTPTPQSLEADSGYGMGFFVREYAGETCYEHSGFWGTLAVYCPDSNVTVATAVSHAEAGFRALRPFTEGALEAVR